MPTASFAMIHFYDLRKMWCSCNRFVLESHSLPLDESLNLSKLQIVSQIVLAFLLSLFLFDQ